MYELSVDSHFAAAHSLRGYNGVCARLHGHTWKVTATIGVSTLDELGMSIDFKIISMTLDEIVGRFDHQTLNDLDEFRDINPSSENLARLIFELLSEKFTRDTTRVLSVTVAESDRHRVTYTKDQPQ